MTRPAAALLGLAAALAAGCGGEGAEPRLVVAAAASLSEPLRACSGDAVRLSFAGSDELAAQIRRGVRPDVFAAANTELPAALAREGLVERPRAFAANELVLGVAEGSGVERVQGAARAGTDVVIGSEAVPVGAYARAALGRLAPDVEHGVLANVRSEEPDVKGVVGKLRQGVADAGFVYRSDLDGLRAVELPERARPRVAYGAAVVRGAREPEAARRYVAGLRRGPCAVALEEAGFGPAPR